MAIVDVKVPQLSESVAEATLLQWKKKPGEAVAMDEILIDEIGHVTYLLGTMAGWQLALVRQIATGYQTYLHRGYGEDYRESVEPIMRGIRDYSLGLFPERVLRRAFVPEPYWPAEYPR